MTESSHVVLAVVFCHQRGRDGSPWYHWFFYLNLKYAVYSLLKTRGLGSVLYAAFQLTSDLLDRQTYFLRLDHQCVVTTLKISLIGEEMQNMRNVRITAHIFHSGKVCVVLHSVRYVYNGRISVFGSVKSLPFVVSSPDSGCSKHKKAV